MSKTTNQTTLIVYSNTITGSTYEADALEDQGISNNLISGLRRMHTVPKYILSCVAASSYRPGIAQEWCCLDSSCSTATSCCFFKSCRSKVIGESDCGKVSQFIRYNFFQVIYLLHTIIGRILNKVIEGLEDVENSNLKAGKLFL